MYEILVQLHNEGDSLMFQGFFKLEIASGEIIVIYYHTSLQLNSSWREI